MTETMKPCPFCGGTATIYGDPVVDSHGIGCRSCSACIDSPGPMQTMVEAWNRRHATPPSYLSDPEWEGMTIEAAKKRALAAERLADSLIDDVRALTERTMRAEVWAVECRDSAGGAVAAMEAACSREKTAITRAEAAEAALVQTQVVATFWRDWWAAVYSALGEALAISSAAAVTVNPEFGPQSPEEVPVFQRAEIVARVQVLVARAEAAERRVAELEADFARLSDAAGEVVRESGFSDGEAVVDGRLVVSLADARCTKSAREAFAVAMAHRDPKPQNPLTGLPCDSLRPTCQQPGCGECFPDGDPEVAVCQRCGDAEDASFVEHRCNRPSCVGMYAREAKPEAPTVHGIKLAVGQRWVHFAYPNTPDKDDVVVRIDRHVGLVHTREANGVRESWPLVGPNSFSEYHGRLRLPEELTPSVASEPAKVEAKPVYWFPWAREGAWGAVETTGVMLRLLRPAMSQLTVGPVWHVHTRDATWTTIPLNGMRPATPEEAEKLEAEYQRNMANRLPVVPATCGNCLLCSPISECRRKEWGSCEAVPQNLPGRVDVMLNEAPPSWCPKRAPKETT